MERVLFGIESKVGVFFLGCQCVIDFEVFVFGGQCQVVVVVLGQWCVDMCVVLGGDYFDVVCGKVVGQGIGM